MFEDFVVISTYSLDDALQDGVLVELFKADWAQLTGGKPIVATAAIAQDVPEPQLQQMWNEFVCARNEQIQRNQRPFLSTTYNGKVVWILEDGSSVTYMYPHEY